MPRSHAHTLSCHIGPAEHVWVRCVTLPACLIPLLMGLSELPSARGEAPEAERQAASPIAATASPHHPFGLHAVRDDFRGVADLNATCIRKIILWQNGEPRRGQYNTLDQMVRSTQQLGLSLVITLRPVSRWGGGDVHSPGGLPLIRYSATPRDMPAWKTFVQKFVERYDGDGIDDMPGLMIPIRFWQVENEILWQWQDSMEDYLAFLAATADTIRRADPRAQIILGGITQCVALAVGAGVGEKDYITYGDENPQQYPREEVLQSSKYRNYKQKVDILLAGAREHCDIVDFHDYGDDAEDLALVVRWLNGEMQRHGYLKSIWTLENAGPFFHFSDEQFARDVVKRHVVAVAAGVERIFWSSLAPTLEWGENFQRLALKDQRGVRAPAYFAYQRMARALDGFQSVEQLDTAADIRVFRFTFGDHRWLDVAWSHDASHTAALSAPEQVQALNVVPMVTGSEPQPKPTRVPVTQGVAQIPLSASPVMFAPAGP